ncbi:MAG TPA: bifunctional serine/threonine-protein kinase/formylglycine-generating enzyme family protein [Phycisphaerae bacterium]|nr:bifunctional serine/threonine-protein kinase/formylglycine-generating enzyme family protein [Phycisphaerae bacterium]
MSADASVSNSDLELLEIARTQIEEAEERTIAQPAQIGHYRILGVLGHGGMGIVYKAEQPHTQRVVAIKVLRSGWIGPEMLQRFEAEAKTLGRLHHVGIAHIYEGGLEETAAAAQPFFAMEFVEGLPITDYCEAHKLDLHARLELLAKVCDAVEHAHQNNVVHRDLKPSNILVDSAGQPKVLDFGVARVTDLDIQSASFHTDQKKLIGTLPYMSPEQIQGDPDSVDARCDVYALGVVGYRMLTGRYPLNVSRQSIPETARAIREDDPAPMGSMNRAYRGDVETILFKALEKLPGRRYQSCADFAADLRRFQHNEPIKARRPGGLYLFRKFARRHTALVGSLTTLFVLLLGGFLVSTWGFRQYYQRVEEVRILVSAAELDRLRDEALKLGPPSPENLIPMARWLERAEALRPLVVETHRELVALHEQPHAYILQPVDDPRLLRRTRELGEVRESLDRARSSLDRLLAQSNPDAVTKKLIAQTRSQIEDLTRTESYLARLVLRNHICEFDDHLDRLRHDSLVKLQRDLQDFFNSSTGLVADIRRRMSVARTIKRDTIYQYRGEWERAIKSVSNPDECPRYADVIQRSRGADASENAAWLVPQIGLVPIGRDPKSGLWEFCHLQSGAAPARDASGKLVVTRATGLVLVLMPGGEFTLGASARLAPETTGTGFADPLADEDESPVHRVRLQPYYISKYEMTAAQWARITRPRGAPASDAGAVTLPVENISWDECESVLVAAGLALPTEAQWEFAARAGAAGPWPNGTAKGSLRQTANLGDEELTQDGYPGQVAPVGRFEPNGFGLFDVSGNVSEWCLDAYGSYEHPVTEGDARRLSGYGEGGYRVTRGGGFRDGAAAARVSARQSAAPNYRREDLGVRPARPLDTGNPIVVERSVD